MKSVKMENMDDLFSNISEASKQTLARMQVKNMIHKYAINGNIDQIKLLLEKNPDIKLIDCDNIFKLSYLTHGKTEVINQLEDVEFFIKLNLNKTDIARYKKFCKEVFNYFNKEIKFSSNDKDFIRFSSPKLRVRETLGINDPFVKVSKNGFILDLYLYKSIVAANGLDSELKTRLVICIIEAIFKNRIINSKNYNEILRFDTRLEEVTKYFLRKNNIIFMIDYISFIESYTFIIENIDKIEKLIKIKFNMDILNTYKDNILSTTEKIFDNNYPIKDKNGDYQLVKYNKGVTNEQFI